MRRSVPRRIGRSGLGSRSPDPIPPPRIIMPSPPLAQYYHLYSRSQGDLLLYLKHRRLHFYNRRRQLLTLLLAGRDEAKIALRLVVRAAHALHDHRVGEPLGGIVRPAGSRSSNVTCGNPDPAAAAIKGE